MFHRNKLGVFATLTVGLVATGVAIADKTASNYNPPKIELNDIRLLQFTDTHKDVIRSNRLTKAEFHTLNQAIWSLRQTASDSGYNAGWLTGSEQGRKFQEYMDTYKEDSAFDRPSSGCMQGVKKLFVLVENIDMETNRVPGFALTKEQLRTDTELKLQQNGITIVPEEAPADYLYINVNPEEWQPGIVNYSISIEMKMDSMPKRNRSHHQFATTWESGAIGISPMATSSDNIRKVVADRVDLFLNEYLKENPDEVHLNHVNANRVVSTSAAPLTVSTVKPDAPNTP